MLQQNKTEKNIFYKAFGFKLLYQIRYAPFNTTAMLGPNGLRATFVTAFCIDWQGCERDLHVRDQYKTETFNIASETRPRRHVHQNFTRPRRDRDVRFSVRNETETRRPPNFPRRDRDNLKQYLSSHNLDAADHQHGCFINSYNTLAPCKWYNPQNIIVGLCAVCIIYESIVNSIQSSCWSLNMKISLGSDTSHILYLV